MRRNACRGAVGAGNRPRGVRGVVGASVSAGRGVSDACEGRFARNTISRSRVARFTGTRARAATRWASALVPAVPDRGRGAKRPNRTQIAIAMRTFFHDVLQAGVVVRGRATLDAVHDVTCRSVGKSGGYAVSHPRARGERGFEPDSANDAHHCVSGSHRSLDARSRGVRGSRRERSRRVRTYPSTGGARRGRSRPGRWYR